MISRKLKTFRLILLSILLLWVEVQTKHTSFLFQAYAALKSSWPLKAGRMVSENTNGAGGPIIGGLAAISRREGQLEGGGEETRENE